MSILTLESAEEAFRHWREHRSSRKESIPEALWSMALELYPQYLRSTICQRLRLSGSQFKRRLAACDVSSRGRGFVLASCDEDKAMLVGTEIQLTLQGQARSMTLCFDMHALAHVLPHVGSLL